MTGSISCSCCSLLRSKFPVSQARNELFPVIGGVDAYLIHQLGAEYMLSVVLASVLAVA